MRMLAAISTCVLISTAAWAQAPAAAPAGPPTSTDKASYMSAAEISATLAKIPKTGNSSNMRVFGLAPYNVNIERRQPVAQNASVHEANAELFYIIDGGARQKLGQGDFFLVPAGIPHQFVDLAPTGITIMSIYLPNAK